MTTSERQRLLQEQYYFLCQCQACIPETEPLGQDQHSGLLCEKCKGEVEVGDCSVDYTFIFVGLSLLSLLFFINLCDFPEKARGRWDQVHVCAGVLRSQRVLFRSELPAAGA